MNGKIKLFAQSCDSRICRKKYKDQITDLCEAVITVHSFNKETKEVSCTECGKSYKLTN